MALRWAVQTGNWSDPATWNGGTLPAVDDNVLPDGKTVTIDQNISVRSLSNYQRSGGTVGGSFVVNTDRTITSSQTIVVGSNTSLIVVNGGTLTIVGSISGTNGVSSSITVQVNGGANLNVTGTVTGGGRTNAKCIQQFGALSNINIVGDMTAASTASGGGEALIGDSFNLTVVGNLFSPNTSSAVVSAGSSTISVTGNVSAIAGAAINFTGAASLVSVTGSVTALASSNAISSSATTNGVVVQGDMIDSPQGAVAVYSRLLRVTPTLNSRTVYYDSSGATGASVLRASLDVAGDHPAPANVRQGTSYAYNQLTGTLAMPAANVVRNGVAVGSTTGTGAVTLTDIASVVGAQIAAGVST